MRSWVWLSVVFGLASCNDKGEATDISGDDDDDTDTDTDPPATGPALTARPDNPTCLAPSRPLPPGEVAIERIFPNLTFAYAVQAIQPPDDADTWWVVLQDGQIVRFADDPGADSTEQVLDIRGRVDDSSNEMGLLSIAFHPQWAINREAIVSYTAADPRRSVIARYRSTDGGLTLDPATEDVLLEQEQPFTNHNGGYAAFGHDGYLYFGFGDGGSGGDPLEAGQDVDTLLGKIIRVDVDAPAPYGIPVDNPFSNGGGRPEIFAWGVRNPWRFSFDSATGDLWLGDVGQNEIEEVDVVRLGGNYGWNIMEGDACYGANDCNRAGKELPLAVNFHADGDNCITGGVVYRGSEIPAIVGTYLWADYASGRLYGLFHDPVSGEPVTRFLLDTGIGPTHIGTSAEQEVILVDRFNGLYTLEPAGDPIPDPFPTTLAATGCFDPAGDPLPMLVPYDVSQSFWSDGAAKSRWLSLPNGSTIETDPAGDLVFPVGSVIAKAFEVGGERVETRLMVRHDDGSWAGYTYAGQDGDAELLLGATDVLGGGGVTWTIPSRSDCLQCHTGPTGGTLGLSLYQLDLDRTQSNGWVENQIDELVRLGMMAEPASRPGTFPALDDDTVAIEDRARAYLAVNCSHCHFEGGTGLGDLDLRREVPLAETGLCDEPQQGSLGIQDARIVAPGDPGRSVLSARIRRRDANQMPPLASKVVDEAGADLVDEWITALPTCP